MRPTRSSSSSNSALSGLFPAIDSGSMMFSSAVSIGSRLKNWKMNPMCLRRSFVISVSLSEPSFVPASVT